MKQLSILGAVLLAFGAQVTYADNDGDKIRAKLTGFQEVPVVSTVAEGSFRATISPDEKFIDFELSYDGLQGSVLQAHIHLGQRSVNGGIVIWLCGTAVNPGPAGTKTCPAFGSVSHTVGAADVVAITGQNVGQQISAGDLAEVIKAIRAGVAYANVHTTLSTGGEIRGQLRTNHRH